MYILFDIYIYRQGRSGPAVAGGVGSPPVLWRVQGRSAVGVGKSQSVGPVEKRPVSEEKEAALSDSLGPVSSAAKEGQEATAGPCQIH